MTLENPTHVPDFAKFKAAYERVGHDRKCLTLQGHPNSWNDERWDAFVKIIDYLTSKGCVFMTPSEYVDKTGTPNVRIAPPNCPACAMGLTAEFVFKRLDVNEDKIVTIQEFTKSPGMQDESAAHDAVGRIDQDANGSLSWEEFAAAYKARHANCKASKPVEGTSPDGRGDGNRFAQVFMMRNDQNGDGKVDRSEFRGAEMGFNRLDENGNGFIEANELGALHKSRMNDPKSMRERLQSGDVRKPPQGRRPRDGANSPDDAEE